MKRPVLLGGAICWISLLVLPGTSRAADSGSPAPPWSIGSPAAAGSGARFGLGLLYDWEELSSFNLFDRWEMSTTGIQVPLALSCFRMKSSTCLFPTLTLEAGSVDVTLDDSLQGSGDLLGAALDVTVAFCDSCPGFAGGGYRFRAIPGLDLHGEHGDDSRLTRDTHVASARLGYVLPGNRFAPYLGLRGQWRDAEIESSGRATKLESDVIEGILGVDARLGGPLFGRLEIMAGGEDEDCGVQLSLAWVGPRRAAPSGTEHAENREQTEERAREIAGAITPRLEQILADFAAARSHLPTDAQLYPRAAVASLLNDTERDLLEALPGFELTAMRDYVQDLFLQARRALGLQAGLGRSAPVRLASLHPVLLQRPQPAPASIDKGAADSWLDRIGRAIERILDSSRNDDLVLDLCVKSVPKERAEFRMRPLSYEPPVPTKVKTNGRAVNVWRGLYSYRVSRRGFKTIEERLNLVDKSGPVLDCELTADSSREAPLFCSLRSGNIERECPE